MNKLFDVRKVKKVNLPSFPEVEVEMFDGLLTEQIGLLSKSDSDYDRGIEVLRYLIKSWSFVDDNEKPLEVNKESLGKLPTKDFMFLMNSATESLDFLEGAKRKS
jgi:hypothetical protein